MLQKLRRLFGCSPYKSKPPVNTVYQTAYKLLKEKVDALLANDQAALQQEYNSLQEVDILGTSDAAEASSNAGKNRYVNVLPYDFNRVQLTGDDDYINASFVACDTSENPCWSYIAAQGPLACTITDFWKMVFEKNCGVLIMLTRTIENNHIKCADYFNQQTGQTAKYGPYRVTTAEVREVSADITRRVLQVKHYKTQEVRQVTHYHYHKWPDHGVPESTEPIRHLARFLWGNVSGKNNTVVHCSAGIGRTGTLMAIDIILRRLWALHESTEPVSETDVQQAIDLPAVVHNLRKQRRGMVQTLEQYYFCYDAILQEIQANLETS